MRFRSLELVRFGAFEGLVLPFRDGARLHVVHGPNGAGKSTTLDALRSVLFGIQPRTRSFRFESNTLRLRAHIVRSDGAELRFVRRTALRQPIWDGEDTSPLGEEVLAPYVAHLDRRQFETLFGLDLPTMAAGGEDLLRGHGEIGRALFGAGLGGQRLTRVITRLEDEQRALHARGARNTRIAELTARRRELQTKLRSVTRSFTGHDRERRELDNASKRLDVCRGELQELEAQRSSLARLRTALAALQPWEAKLAERAAASPRPPFPAEVSRTVLDHAARRSELRRRIAERATRRSALEADLRTWKAEVREDVLEAATRIDELAERRGAARVQLEQDDAHSRIEIVQRELAEALARAGHDGGRSAAEDPLVAAPRGDLAAEADARLDILRGAEDQLTLAKRETLRAEAAVTRAQEDTQASSADARFAAKLAALAPFHGDLAALRSMAVPAGAVVIDAVRTLTDLERALAAAKQEERHARSELDELDARLARVRDAAAGPPPTWDEVAAARRARDTAVDTLVAAGGAPHAVLALQRAITAADALVDRLAARADDAAQRAQLESAHRRAESATSTAARRSEEAQEALRAVEQAWRACWATAPFVPLTPVEMQRWCERRLSLLAHVDDERAKAEQELGRRRDELATKRAEELLAQAGFDARREEWRRWTVGHGLDPDVPPSLLRTRLGALREAQQRRVQLVELEERHTRRTRDLAAFVHEVEGLAGTLRVEAEPEAIREALAADEAALHHAFARLDALIDARRHAEVVRREVARLQVQLAKEGEGAIGDAEQLAAVEQELSRLAAEAACGSDAGAADVADCVAHAERSAALRALDGELERLQRAFLVHSNGRSADEVRSELVDRDAATLQAAAHDVDERVRALVRERDELQRSVTELTTRVEGGSDADDAAILAAEIASVDAELVDAAQTFLRASLAKHLLDREVDAYRRETQGPLLERTQELFRELTLGAYVCLHPSERGKESVMVGRRPDDTTVHVEGMSTGTRDQLYLALRIASVEHKLTAIEPQPFIADDLFVNFDDARTAAALRVLAELGRRTQVIVFTHHDNVLAACEALTQDGVEVDVLRLPAEHVRFGARGGRSDEWSGAGGNGTEE